MTRDGDPRRIDTSALMGPPHADPVCIRGRLGIGLDEWTPQQWREHGACVRAAAYRALPGEHPVKAAMREALGGLSQDLAFDMRGFAARSRELQGAVDRLRQQRYAQALDVPKWLRPVARRWRRRRRP